MKNETEYVCECGKSFKHQNSLSAHKAFCELEKEKRRKRREGYLKEYLLPNGKFRCKFCGGEHDGSYGSGIFCSKKCRMRYIGTKSYETKVRKGTFISPFSEKGGGKGNRNAYNNWKCSTCGKIFRTRREMQSHYRKEHYNETPFSSWNKGLKKENDKRIQKYVETLQRRILSGQIIPGFKGKQHSKKTKEVLSKKQKENIRTGKSSGWKKISGKRESFPEKFWKNVLDSNNIKYDYQFRVTHKSLGLSSGLSYFLDFSLPGKLDLEIDGSQHKKQDQKEKDKIRTKNLEKCGWTVYRIEWNDIRSPIGKIKMKEKIDLFLSWYKNFCEIHSC